MSLRYVLLALLADGPNTGYGLGRLLRGELRHLRTARLQQIYGELHQMLLKGLVDVAETKERNGLTAKKVYSVTGPGEADLDRWLASWPERAGRDDLLVQLHMLHRVPAQLIQLNLRRRAEENRQRIATLERWSAAVTGGKRLAAEGGLARLRADEEWCQMALAALDAHAGNGLDPRKDSGHPSDAR